MQGKTKETIIRHLKGIVAALEKEEVPPKLELGSALSLEKDINRMLDGEWNDGNNHRMTFILPVGARELGIKQQAILVKIAADRRIEVDVESGHARYCIITFSK